MKQLNFENTRELMKGDSQIKFTKGFSKKLGFVNYNNIVRYYKAELGIPQDQWYDIPNVLFDLIIKKIRELEDVIIAGKDQCFAIEKLKKQKQTTLSQRNNSTLKSLDGDGTRGEKIKGFLNNLSKEYLDTSFEAKGKKAKGSAKDPTEYLTYKCRVSVLQAVLRSVKDPQFTESEISIIAEEYTVKYNQRFSTNFGCYHSKRRKSKYHTA